MTSGRVIKSRSVPSEHDLPDSLGPILQRILSARGVLTSDDLDITLSRLESFDSLRHIQLGAMLIRDCVVSDGKLMIVGDYDADGATSIAVAIRALRAMGAKDVDYLVPNRFNFGYGLTPEIVEVAHNFKPDLIVTVDNGISSIEGVRLARSKGIKVLVTDHHLPGKSLPNANAIINPNQVDDAFPSKNLAGVGVIFYVMAALRQLLRREGWFQSKLIDEPRLANLLDLVALGTVADVVPLDLNNRRLVHYGLSQIKREKCQIGLLALLKAAGKTAQHVTSSDLGFVLGPRLNAAGRLSDMSLGIECLLSDDPQKCMEMALELTRLNAERKDIESEMKERAFSLISEVIDEPGSGDGPFAFSVFHKDWHQGVVGIVAARIKDRFHRPAIAFALVEDGLLKGSARSITGVNIRDALESIATKYPNLIESFGGHAAAAGLTVKLVNFVEFCEHFSETIKGLLNEENLKQTISTDGVLEAKDFTLALASQIESISPWGQKFPEPKFYGEFFIKERYVVGELHARLLLETDENVTNLSAIAFGAAEEDWFLNASRIKAVYHLAVNRYRGQETLQLNLDFAESV